MVSRKIKIGSIPAILYGENSERIFIFVHGRHSYKEEAETFAQIMTRKGYQVLSFDLPEHGERKTQGYPCTIQNAVHDLRSVHAAVKDAYNSISLFACSLGAYFCLTAYRDLRFSSCLFLSPVLDMEKLIRNMMQWSGINEKELQEAGEIETSFGEKLSWDYYAYVKNHPVTKWESPTAILFGENDNVTEKDTLHAFASRFHCAVEIMEKGEHHFHTPEQLDFFRQWIRAQPDAECSAG